MWWVLEAHAATMYVQGSSLNLRSAPAADASVVDQLSINTALEVVETKGAFVKVRTTDDELGWVASEFLGPEALTVADALARAHAASTPADRLSWAQRAAAVEPTDEALVELEAAYRANHDDAGAETVARERRWPSSLLLVASQSPATVLELALESQVPGAEGNPVSRPTFERRFRMSPNLKGWLLMDQGPALATSLAGARKVALAPCKKSGATVAFVPVPVPMGRTAIAFSASPPSSWNVDLRGSPVPEDKARAAADAGLAKLGGEDPQSWLVPTADGWFVRYASTAGGTTTVVDLIVTSAGEHEISRDSSSSTPMRPVAVRDVNGDGQPDVLFDDSGCQRVLVTIDGPVLARTAPRCCPVQ